MKTTTSLSQQIISGTLLGCIVMVLSFFVFLSPIHAAEPADNNAVPSKIYTKGDIFSKSTGTTITDSNGEAIGYTQQNILTFLPKNVVDILFALFTTIGSVMVLVSGARIIFAKGDVKKVQEGIQIVVYTIAGMIIIGSAWFIIRIILDINFGG